MNFNRLTKARHGEFLYNRNDVYIGRSLEVYGEVNEIELDLLRQLCGPGSCVFDVGANIGDHTVPLAQHVGESGFVFAFEPQRVVFQTLCANVALNGLLNVECVHAAVGAVGGLVHVPEFDYRREGNYGGVGLAQFTHGRPVRVIVLDDFTDVARADLVKIDVEGMECEVIAGARAFIARFRPALYVENDRVERSAELIDAIAALGYRLYWHLPPLFNERNFRAVSDNVFAGIVSCNMLCIPQESMVALAGFAEIVDRDKHPFVAS